MPDTKYKTPNGQIVNGSELQAKYGDKFSSLIQDKTFSEVTEPVYKTPNGKYESESVLKTKYGDKFNELSKNNTFVLDNSSQKKKTELQPTSTPQKLDSGTSTGSSGGINQAFKSNIPSPIPSFTPSQIKAESRKSIINKIRPLADKATTITNEDNKSTEADYNQALNGGGFIQGLKEGFSNTVNNITGVLSKVADVHPDDEKSLKVKVDAPLKHIQDEVVNEAIKNKESITPAQTTERVKAKFIDKRNFEIRQSRLNELNSNLSDSERADLKDYSEKSISHLGKENKDLLKSLPTLKGLRDDSLTSLENFKSQISEFQNNNQTIPDDLINQYKDTYAKVVKYDSDLNTSYSKFTNNRKDIGTAQQEFDVYKTEAGNIHNFVQRVDNAVIHFGAGALDFIGYLGGALGEDQASDGMHELASKTRKIAQTSEEYLRKTSTVENFKDLINITTDFVATNSPMVIGLTASGGAGLAGMTATATGDKWGEMKDEEAKGDASYSKTQKILAPMAYGAAMIAPMARQLGTIKNSVRVLEAIAKESPELIESTLRQKASDYITKSGVKFASDSFKLGNELKLMEVLQEGVNHFGLGKDFDYKKISDLGVYKTAPLLHVMNIVSAHLLVKVVEPFMTKDETKQLDNNSKVLFDLHTKLNDNSLSTEEITITKNTIDNISKQSRDLVKGKIKSVTDTPQVVTDAIIDSTQKSSDYRGDAIRIKASDKFTPEQKKVMLADLKVKYSENESHRVDLISGTKTAFDLLSGNEQAQKLTIAERKIRERDNADGKKENFEVKPEEAKKLAKETYLKELSEKKIEDDKQSEQKLNEQTTAPEAQPQAEKIDNKDKLSNAIEGLSNGDFMLNVIPDDSTGDITKGINKQGEIELTKEEQREVKEQFRLHDDGDLSNKEFSQWKREFGKKVAERYNSENQEISPEIAKPVSEDVVTPSVKTDISKKTIDDLEKRQAEIEGDKQHSEEFNKIDKELEKREWKSVMLSPLSDVKSVLENLEQKEKTMPNGFGSYIEKKDIRESKGIVDKYQGEVSKDEAANDFKDAFFGKPSTWYADGLKLKESVRVFIEKGGTFKELLQSVQKEFEADGFTEQDAASVINRKLSEITKVNEATPTTDTPTNGNVQLGVDNVAESGIAKQESPKAESVPSSVDGGEVKGDTSVGNKSDISFPTKLEVTEVKPYTEVEHNYYRPDQQLKFNQGTYEPVRIIAHPDVIKAISIGAKLINNPKVVSESDTKFSRDVAKKFGYTSNNGDGSAIMLNRAVREIAKQNRTNTHEVFIKFGEENKPTETPQPKAVKGDAKVGKKADSIGLADVKEVSVTTKEGKSRPITDLDIAKSNLKFALIARDEASEYLKTTGKNPFADKVTYNKAKLADAKRKIKSLNTEIDKLNVKVEAVEEAKKVLYQYKGEDVVKEENLVTSNGSKYKKITFSDDKYTLVKEKHFDSFKKEVDLENNPKLNGKKIEPHSEINTNIETVKKELNLSEVDNLIYDEFKDTPKTEEEIYKKLEKVNDNLYGKVEEIEGKIDDIDTAFEKNGEAIDKINDDESLTPAKKKKAVAEKEKEFKDLQKQQKALEEQKSDTEQFIKDISDKLYDWEAEENVAIVNGIVDKVNNRLETRKSVKEGTNLFPEDANIPEFVAVKKELIKLTDEKTITDFNSRTAEQVKESEPIVADIKSKAKNAERISKEELEKGIADAEKLLEPKPTTKEQEVKDLGSKARDLAKEYRSGKNVLPDWLRQDEAKGSKTNGINLNEAFANALDTFADVHDVTKDLAKAVNEGFKHIKDWYDKNGSELNEEALNDLKSKFQNHVELTIGDKERSNTNKKTGASHQSLINLADRLGLEQPERGQYIDPETQLKRGRLLLKNGASAEDVEVEFNRVNKSKVSADEISVARAHQEVLVDNVDSFIDKGDKTSEEFKNAKLELERWNREVLKPMGTIFHEIGSALQGESDMNTESFTSVRKAFVEQNKVEPTKSQEKQVEVNVEKVKKLTNEVEQLKQKLSDLIDKHIKEEEQNPKKKTFKEKAKEGADVFRKLKTRSFDFTDENGNVIKINTNGVSWNDAVEFGAKAIEKSGEIADGIEAAIKKLKQNDWYKGLSDKDKDRFRSELGDYYKTAEKEVDNKDLFTRFVDKKDNKFTNEEVKAIWTYAKSEYLDKNSTIPEMLSGVATDLGLTTSQVRNAISQPKGARVITDEMYITQMKRNRAVSDAKRFVKTANTPKAIKWLKAIPDFFFKAKTFGHGTVGFVTHTGANIFRPSEWRIFLPFFYNQFKFAFGSVSRYEQAMEDLQLHPDFIFWKRAGLAVDPQKISDDYQGSATFFGKMGAIGDRGFNALKPYRLQLAKQLYDGLSESSKSSSEMAKEIARLVNHSTGTHEVNVPKWVQTSFFAPKLEASKWSNLILDPLKAIKTYTVGYNKSTPTERASAKIVARRSGEMVATYMALLAMNSASLALNNSKDKINYTSPNDPDWLKFKSNGKTIDISGGMVSSLRFLSTLINIAMNSHTGEKGRGGNPQNKAYESLGTQARYKLSPFAGTVMDFTFGTDAMGKPLPKPIWNVGSKKEPYTIATYIMEQQSPIPVGEGIRVATESMRERGMKEAQIRDIWNGVAAGIIAGGTGARISPIREPITKTKHSYNPNNEQSASEQIQTRIDNKSEKNND